MEHYPKRPKYFSHQFCRLMTKACVANRLGAEVCWLLTVIVHQEDARHYRLPGVTFFNEQLLPLIGVGSVDSLDRIRKKAIAMGWLHYESGGKGKPGLYWVLIPAEWADSDDGPTDEGGDEYFRKNAEQSTETNAFVRENAEGSAETTAREAGDKCGTFIPNPIPDPNTRAPRPKKAHEPLPQGFAEFWEVYPRKVAKRRAIKAWLKLSPDSKTQAAIIEAVNRQSTSKKWREENGQYIPHPATWLNDGRWEDEEPNASGNPVF